MKIFTVMLFILLVSCTASPKERANHEAIMLHNSILKKADLIKHRLNELLNGNSNVNRDSLRVLIDFFQEWKADLVEVPGNEDHSHHDHGHSYQPAPEVTSEQMIKIQKELDARLAIIGQKASALKPDLVLDEHAH
jgi:hypothetical protein